MAIPVSDVSSRIPCDMPWASMAAAPGGRYCDQCDLTVHDLSAMTERAVRTLLATRHEQRVCIRYQPRRDGTIRTAHEPVIPASRLLAKAKPALLAMSMLAAACGTDADTHEGRGKTTPTEHHASCDPSGMSAEPDCDPLLEPTPPGGMEMPPPPPPVQPDAGTAPARPTY